MYVPFGEEYLSRYAIDNPLISHSLSDLWGVDEGVELYGKVGPVRYTMAVQNGGIPDTLDYNDDKSVAGRLEYDPARWLHLSASGMRTGDLQVSGDQLSAMWFGNGFLNIDRLSEYNTISRRSSGRGHPIPSAQRLPESVRRLHPIWGR